MPHASGMGRPPVQKLVASIRFAPQGQIGHRVPSGVPDLPHLLQDGEFHLHKKPPNQGWTTRNVSERAPSGVTPNFSPISFEAGEIFYPQGNVSLGCYPFWWNVVEGFGGAAALGSPYGGAGTAQAVTERVPCSNHSTYFIFAAAYTLSGSLIARQLSQRESQGAGEARPAHRNFRPGNSAAHKMRRSFGRWRWLGDPLCAYCHAWRNVRRRETTVSASKYKK